MKIEIDEVTYNSLLDALNLRAITSIKIRDNIVQQIKEQQDEKVSESNITKPGPIGVGKPNREGGAE